MRNRMLKITSSACLLLAICAISNSGLAAGNTYNMNIHNYSSKTVTVEHINSYCFDGNVNVTLAPGASYSRNWTMINTFGGSCYAVSDAITGWVDVRVKAGSDFTQFRFSGTNKTERCANYNVTTDRDFGTLQINPTQSFSGGFYQATVYINVCEKGHPECQRYVFRNNNHCWKPR